jgi:hypothetical protein
MNKQKNSPVMMMIEGLFSMVPVVPGRQESIIILRSGPAYASARNRIQSEECR